MTFKPKPYDEALIKVALEGGFTFTFEIQDWEDDGPDLDDGAAFAMADDLVRSGAELYGVLMLPSPPVRGLAATNGESIWTRLDPARIVCVGIKPMGAER